MDIVTLDFETFWDGEYTLKKMSPIAYVMDDRFQFISLSAKVNDGETVCVFGESDIRHLTADLNLPRRAALAHNMSTFDSLLLAWRLKVLPRMFLCTLAMARPVHAKTSKLSLAALVELYGIGTKNAEVLHDTRGKRLENFTPDERRRMAIYNCADTDQCWELFKRLRVHFSPSELWHLDCNIRMLVEPQFKLDVGLLETALSVERSNKHRAMLTLAKHLGGVHGEGWSCEQLVADTIKKKMNSAAQFAQLLTERGIEVPMKRSKTDPRKLIPAIAKTDEQMQDLLDHDDEVIAAAARARLSAKSTQLETRIESFLQTVRVTPGNTLPVPAHYCGADTTGRDSGFLYNMYNLPRIIPGKPKVSDALRRSVLAPRGHKIGVADSSGIELRVNHTLWMVERSMRMWAENPTADLYIGTATAYYGVPDGEITKSDPRRQLGKVLELSCGFGIGARKLRDQARAQYGLRLTPEEAARGVAAWRQRYPEISSYESGGWGACQDALQYIAAGQERAIDPWGLCHTAKDMIVGPTGRVIRYPDLRYEMTVRFNEVDGELVEKKEKQWVYAEGRHKAYLYGGKVDENIVQFLAREIIFEQALEFFKRTGWRPKHKVYDELCYVWPEAQAEELLAELQAVMRTPPKWWPSIVLWSEGDVAVSYGDAK
jgi:DNA polymerase